MRDQGRSWDAQAKGIAKFSPFPFFAGMLGYLGA
jgi:hypothetical protein